MHPGEPTEPPSPTKSADSVDEDVVALSIEQLRVIHNEAGCVGVPDTTISRLNKLAACKKPTQFELAIYIAELVLVKYRYVLDTIQNKDFLLWFDGSLYRYDRPDNCYVYAQHSVIAVLNAATERTDGQFMTNVFKILGMVSSKDFRSTFDQVNKELKSSHFYIERRLTEPQELFRKLDRHPYMIGCKNGIYDLKTGHFYSRGSIPSGVYVTMSVGYDFIGDVNGDPANEEQERKMLELEELVYNKIFPEEATRLCAQSIFASMLISGSGVTKKLFCAIGQKGNNGKTVLFNTLLQHTLGDYYYCLRNNAIYNPNQSADACEPNLVLARKCKVAVLNEGDQNRPLNASLVKELTGGDPINARNLHSQPVREEFYPKLVLLSNYVPVIAGHDPALLRRIYPLDHVAVFDKTIDKDDPSNYVWKAMCETDLRIYLEEAAPFNLLLMIRWAKKFMSSQFLLPDVPMSSVAQGLIMENTIEHKLREILEEGYVKVSDSKEATDLKDLMALGGIRGTRCFL